MLRRFQFLVVTASCLKIDLAMHQNLADADDNAPGSPGGPAIPVTLPNPPARGNRDLIAVAPDLDGARNANPTYQQRLAVAEAEIAAEQESRDNNTGPQH